MIKYKIITKYEILHETALNTFNLRQEVNKCWRLEEGEWRLKDVHYVEDWDDKDKKDVISTLNKIIRDDGTVILVLEDDSIIGFASLPKDPWGSKNQYLILSMLYVSSDYRGIGIGRNLFNESVKVAAKNGAKKLYISAHSAEDTVAFYRNVGCCLARELHDKLMAEEPYDMQLEYKIER